MAEKYYFLILKFFSVCEKIAFNTYRFDLLKNPGFIKELALNLPVQKPESCTFFYNESIG